jgi:hypothetical protein
MPRVHVPCGLCLRAPVLQVPDLNHPNVRLGMHVQLQTVLARIAEGVERSICRSSHLAADGRRGARAPCTSHLRSRQYNYMTKSMGLTLRWPWLGKREDGPASTDEQAYARLAYSTSSASACIPIRLAHSSVACKDGAPVQAIGSEPMLIASPSPHTCCAAPFPILEQPCQGAVSRPFHRGVSGLVQLCAL